MKVPKKYIIEGACNKCGKCCKTLRVKIDYRIDGKQLQYLKTRGVEVKYGQKWTILTFPLRCPNLKMNNECKIHDTQSLPWICVESPNKMWHHEEGCGYTISPMGDEKKSADRLASKIYTEEHPRYNKDDETI